MLNEKTTFEHKLLALTTVVSGLEMDVPIKKLISAYIDLADSSDPYYEALDYCSLLLLARDTRNNIVNGYVNSIDDILEDEHRKTLVYKHVQEIAVVIDAYIKKIDVDSIYTKEVLDDD